MEYKSPFLVHKDIRTCLIGDWNLGDKIGSPVLDQSGNNNDGVITGAIRASDLELGSKKILDFDGVDDFINVPDSASMRVANGDFSFSMWFKRDTLPGVIINLIGSENGVASNKGWNVRFGSIETVDFNVNDGTGIYTAGGPGTTTLEANKWYFLTCVVESGVSIRYYLNTVLEESLAITGLTLFEKNYGLDIGNAESAVDRWFNGKLNDIRLYNCALTQDEINQLHRYYIRKYGVKFGFND